MLIAFPEKSYLLKTFQKYIILYKYIILSL